MRNPLFLFTIECRMSSTRLPGKVMKKFGKYPAIEMLIKRIKKNQMIF